MIKSKNRINIEMNEGKCYLNNYSCVFSSYKISKGDYKNDTMFIKVPLPIKVNIYKYDWWAALNFLSFYFS